MRPCSTSCIKAADVTGLVIDAMRNSELAATGRPVDTSATPNAP